MKSITHMSLFILVSALLNTGCEQSVFNNQVPYDPQAPKQLIENQIDQNSQDPDSDSLKVAIASVIHAHNTKIVNGPRPEYSTAYFEVFNGHQLSFNSRSEDGSKGKDIQSRVCFSTYGNGENENFSLSLIFPNKEKITATCSSYIALRNTYHCSVCTPLIASDHSYTFSDRHYERWENELPGGIYDLVLANKSGLNKTLKFKSFNSVDYSLEMERRPQAVSKQEFHYHYLIYLGLLFLIGIASLIYYKIANDKEEENSPTS